MEKNIGSVAWYKSDSNMNTGFFYFAEDFPPPTFPFELLNADMPVLQLEQPGPSQPRRNTAPNCSPPIEEEVPAESPPLESPPPVEKGRLF